MKLRNESGIALITALLILVLLGVLLQGFVLAVNSDQNLVSINRDHNRSFYSALAGLEQLTADIGTLFDNNYMPSNAQITALTANPPILPYTSFVSPGGGSGYQITYPKTAGGLPRADNVTIPSGPYEGLIGQLTPFTITATAKTGAGAEVRMQRTLQTVQVPVFQFGIFSENDLSFFAGPNFNFGGRVHTNSNLFLAEGDGATLTMKDRVTAVGEVVRAQLSNGWPTSSTYNGTVNVSTSPGAYRNLQRTEGSVTGGLGSPDYSGWANLSRGTYNGNILNGDTGARRMDLPLVSNGAAPIDIIRRPRVNSAENAASPDLYQQRFYSFASLRILLSDTAADITNLPTVNGTAPIRLANPLPAGVGAQFVGEAHRASPLDAALRDTDFKSPNDTSLIDGFIKIEMQGPKDTWTDVTQEIMALGISGPDLTGSCTSAVFYPNSIIRVQRLMDSPSTTPCGGTSPNQKYQFWPNVLYDSREGLLRDNIGTGDTRIYMGGVMHYVELDVTNLARWFTGAIAGTGGNALRDDNEGYVVYFSDRRTNYHNPAMGNEETAKYGAEDFVNPADIANGAPDGLGETGEDVDGSGGLDTYGTTPVLPAGAISPLNAGITPYLFTKDGNAVTAGIARKNRAIFFRRALKLVNGQTFNLGSNSDGVNWGLSIASENPVYVQGNYNASGGNFDGVHRACSILADAVTLLSNNWNDRNSFTSPNNPGGRNATTTWYRTAVIAGKGISFNNINMSDTDSRDFGTDGGAHNFLRYLENWGGQTLNYRGSIVSLYVNQQASGTYKCCTNVYSPPSRGYNFDTEFLQIQLLPPKTPRFHDINITGFTQMKMPNQ
jgi:hypothetical protein